MRTSFIAGNWKMNLNGAEATALVEAVARGAPELPACELAVFPPFVHLREAAEAAVSAKGRLAVGAQNCHFEDRGAFTGEVSAPMARAAGATWVIVGHSERRRDCGEDDTVVARKLRAALRAKLRAIVCVGETLEQRDAGQTLEVVRSQVDGAFHGLDPADLASIAIAYEPVWAIGTGRNATPKQAAEVHRAIRDWVAARFGTAAAEALRILYGGSVTADNAAALLAEAEIDGALVGGASLVADSFLRIARHARA